MKKFFKIASNVLTVFVIVIALFLMVTIFPITGNYKVLTVLSGSMEPSIHTGSIVVVKPLAEYKVGDVITFGEISKTKIPITHRIYEIKDNKFITKGDANDSPDMKEVLPREVVGKVLFSVPWVGHVVSAAQKPIGFAIVIILPAIFIVYDEIKKIKNEVKRMITKKKNKDHEQDVDIDKVEDKIEKLEKEIKKMEHKK
jgi:signal peptidase I